MDLTVADLAHAVGKSENYIRQHIHRKHLIARKDGRRVSVALDEAMRWARERRLPFVSPAHAVTTGSMERRTARMTVLTSHERSAQPINLFTLIRHRRRGALGPWATQSDETWTHDDFGAHGLRLFTIDASFERCQALVDRIKDSGTLRIDGTEVGYALEPVPRRHWAYRDAIRRGDDSIPSPFSRHSAEIIEYWSLEQQPRKLWRDVLASASELRPRLAGLGFPLDSRSDRVGNLMIAGAADEVRCDLKFHRDRTLRFHVDTNDMPPTSYRATVWASHSGDEVFRQEFRVTGSYTLVELGSDVDRIGFAIYRVMDGQCVDSRDAVLVKEISNHIHLDSRPTLDLYDRRGHLIHRVKPRGSGVMFNINADDGNTEIDNEIRRLSLDWGVHEREAAARREGNLVRFRPSEFDQAALHFIETLRNDSHQTAPIYVADPYFMPKQRPRGAEAEHHRHDHVHDLEDHLIRLYLDMFAATADRPLRILCGTTENDSAPWWSGFPSALTSHVTVRSFIDISGRKPKPGFHDRYLITPARELLITNSFNGWSKHGVTFASLQYGVYRSEAMQLWALEEGSTSTPLRIQELR